MIRITLKRTENKIQQNLSDNQFVFQKGKATIDATRYTRTMTKTSLEVTKKVYEYFNRLRKDIR